MAAVELRVDLTALLDAIVAGNTERVTLITRELLAEDRNADVLIGRIGIQALLGDEDGHVGITIGSLAMIARMLRVRPAPLDQQIPPQTRALPLFLRAAQIAAPALRAAQTKTYTEPEAFFPSELLDSGKSMNEVINQAVQQGDTRQVERMLLGFYGTGADYRTLEVRAYEALTTTFHNNGHPLIATIRGFQLLDAVEWAKRVPALLHWLAPLLTAQTGTEQTAWIGEVHSYAVEPAHSLASIRTRLAAPKDENALAVRDAVLSNTNTTQVCQTIFDAIIKNGATPRAVASVLALSAAELLQQVDDSNRAQFIDVAHGLLYASATRIVFSRVQDVEALNLIYTAGAYINALYKQVTAQNQKAQPIIPSTPTTGSGGMIAITQLETIEELLKNKDTRSALATAQRYLNLGHDARALFGTIGLGATRNDASIDQGHSLQIVQAAGEEYVAWPRALAGTNIDAFLQAALRAAAFGQRDTLIPE
ncbi:MAG TPA: hypothetical protein VL461_01590 [Dictyobacter sp.]|jgi:hypothetical protein|nr:hypothetical protein [Dictyobacter sp.]